MPGTISSWFISVEIMSGSVNVYKAISVPWRQLVENGSRAQALAMAFLPHVIHFTEVTFIECLQCAVPRVTVG